MFNRGFILLDVAVNRFMNTCRLLKSNLFYYACILEYIVHYFKKEQLKNIQDILDFCTIFNTVRAITNTKQMNAIRSRWTR